MRWLAVVAVLLLTGCAGAPQQRSNGLAVAVPPRAELYRPWLVPRPSDQFILFDTRVLQAMRELDEIGALNANGSVTRPGLWLGIGLAVVAGFAAAESADDHEPCVSFSDCEQP